MHGVDVKKKRKKRKLRLREKTYFAKRERLLFKQRFIFKRRTKARKFTIVFVKVSKRLNLIRNSLIKNDNDIQKFIK